MWRPHHHTAIWIYFLFNWNVIGRALFVSQMEESCLKFVLMTLIASIITFSKKRKKNGKKMLPSTLDMVSSPSTWNPRPSTLDKKIDSLDDSYHMKSWCLYFRALLSKIALHILLFVEQNAISPSLITAWFSLLVFLRFYIWGLFSCLKFKTLLIRFAVIRTTDLCCLHFE